MKAKQMFATLHARWSVLPQPIRFSFLGQLMVVAIMTLLALVAAPFPIVGVIAGGGLVAWLTTSRFDLWRELWYTRAQRDILADMVARDLNGAFQERLEKTGHSAPPSPETRLH